MKTAKSITVATSLLSRRARNAILIAGLLPTATFAQTTFTWQQIKEKFETANPTLKAAQLNIDESRAAEIQAYVRPNPDANVGFDQINPFTTQPPPTGGANVYSPFAYTEPYGSISYLHERDHKRELRRDQARESTAIAQSTYLDQERSLLFNLHNAFVQVLQSKVVLQNTQENLAYWDHELEIFRKSLTAGAIAQVDFDRLKLQRAQFESDYEGAMVNLRTAKIQLLMLLNDRTPIEKFDVTGPFDFAAELKPLEDYRRVALEARPDLRAAVQNVQLAQITHQLAISNGSTDPTFSVDFGRNPPIPAYLGVSVSIPLRIFDRNQGQKALTQIDIGRNERLRDANEAQVFNDVDSAYWTILQSVNLLKPYRTEYVEMAGVIRDRIALSYKSGGAALVDYLDAEKAYRDVRLAYINLIGSYLTAAAQMNMAVGREVL